MGDIVDLSNIIWYVNFINYYIVLVEIKIKK